MRARSLVPSVDSLRVPTLWAMAFDPSGKGVGFAEILERVAKAEGLPPKALKARFPSGHGPVFDKRLGWAMDMMKDEGLVERLQSGAWRLTEEGKRSLTTGRPRNLRTA